MILLELENFDIAAEFAEALDEICTQLDRDVAAGKDFNEALQSIFHWDLHLKCWANTMMINPQPDGLPTWEPCMTLVTEDLKLPLALLILGRI